MSTTPKPPPRKPLDDRLPGEVSISGERRPPDAVPPADTSGDAAPLESFEQPRGSESPDAPAPDPRPGPGGKAIDAV